MPSKGTRVTPVRIPPDLREQIDAAVARSVRTARGEPYNVSTWILAAIREKLDHARRSRKRTPKTVQTVQPEESQA